MLPLSGAITAALMLTPTPATLEAQTTPPSAMVRTLTDTLPGRVGGVTVDRIGLIYVADFQETVWKVTPDGKATRFVTGLYGASGNAIDSKGYLLQSSFSGNYISKIDRLGNQTVLVDSGLAGPVGITVDQEDNLYVTNCRANTISKVTQSGQLSTFASGNFFNCPNGITRDPNGNTYVVNFSDERMLKITPDGAVSEFATLPGGGNGHVTFARGDLYATSFRGHRIYRVSLAGEVTPIAGTGTIGEQDGPGPEATFSWPNGIAAGPQGDRLYVNDFINRFPPTLEVLPQPLAVVRQIKLPSFSDALAAALESGGVGAMRTTYRAWKADATTGGVFTEAEVNQLGYQLMGRNQLEAATELFKLNVESYPQSFNVYDSLAEAYMNGGKNDQAIEFYQKSLELNPANTNAVQMMKKIRGN
jgi:sugar lactone lactonase YvrE